MMVVEEEGDLVKGLEGFEFVKWFNKCLKWFKVYFEVLDESFRWTSNERLILEWVARRATMDLMAGARNRVSGVEREGGVVDQKDVMGTVATSGEEGNGGPNGGRDDRIGRVKGEGSPVDMKDAWTR
ncbi:hypothetical protein Fmac_006212 [Flemingia macrophylla]|uniref:Uncharacterized protein n=1 Tax=Flemingia macrophylla TaxID=520843 RepID=A0ABD1NB64_9FABA